MAARLFRHGVVDSTNERAFAALASGDALHNDAHVAEGQSAGRGRHGRRWESARGEGLYLSLILLPDPPPPNPAALTMGAGLALLEAVHELGALGARLEWPNDVLAPVEERWAKLAGILVESRGLDRLHPHAIVGVGVNVRQREFPAALASERAVTSLALLGCDVSCDRARDVVLARLRPWMDQACRRPAAVARDYAVVSGLLGKHVRVRRGRDELRGRLVGLSLDGVELALASGGHAVHPLEHVQELEAQH